MLESQIDLILNTNRYKRSIYLIPMQMYIPQIDRTIVRSKDVPEPKGGKVLNGKMK